MTHPMHGANRFKLGIFSANADGGLTLTKVPERWPARWPEIVQVVQMADAAGIEFFLPIARWKGFEGETNSRQHSFETFTFAAALAGVTRNIALFSTVHVPMVHPIFAAKALATVDHASGGRAGLNIVAGWNPDEFAMFGLERTDAPYEQAAEWISLIERLYTAPEPFDFEGKFYSVKGAVTAPKSLQSPRPVVLNAAFSPPGRAFAAAHADYLFTTFVDIEGGRETISDISARAAEAGRSVGTYTTTHVVCRPSQDEAEAYYERYAVTEADQGALDYHTSQKMKHAASHDPETFARHQKRFAGGAGTYPLVGTPEHIAAEMVRMADAGFAGTTVSFVNFLDELPYFLAEVLPLLREAGLRQ
ncbi:LLM class flavin-dependent oxidoreductase [Oceanicella sp. SM1341]|uniref:LLM class flavin-dependent oxidoreductase n=1 Tax=Oceanicella sp. SM1341 TaxID=1548889 RepID=UPI000E48B1F5|nr:LLM class flavin-dependent oxidoreductase [Oceanicella sp. SM1341]